MELDEKHKHSVDLDFLIIRPPARNIDNLIIIKLDWVIHIEKNCFFFISKLLNNRPIYVSASPTSIPLRHCTFNGNIFLDKYTLIKVLSIN